MLLCTTSPTSSLRSMPPPLVGEALAFRNVFQQVPISFIENETSLPRARPLGELARQRLRGQARQNKTRKHSDTMSLTNRACIAVFFAFCQHPCPLRHGFAVPPCPLSALACHLPRPGESFKVRGFGIPQGLLLSPEALKSVCRERFNYSSSRRFLMTRVIAAPATTASIRM